MERWHRYLDTFYSIVDYGLKTHYQVQQVEWSPQIYFPSWNVPVSQIYYVTQSVALFTFASHQCCGSGSGPIRTFLVGSGSGSGRLGLDPNPDPGLDKWPYIYFFEVCKSQKYFRNLFSLTFWFMKILSTAYCGQKISRRNFRTFSKVGSGSGQKSSGLATLLLTNAYQMRVLFFLAAKTLLYCTVRAA
jgi:hypothetical protein